MFPRRVCTTVVALGTSVRTYSYQPPGSVMGERRLPWQHGLATTTTTPVSPVSTAARRDDSPLLSHVLQVPATPPVSAATPPLVNAGDAATVVMPSTPVPVAPAPSRTTVSATAHASASNSQSSRVGGGLRSTGTLRMPALPGPNLDTRIEDIVKTEETVSSEPLPKVVQLLIDPEASNVERITMADFVAMQPKRQLMALGGKKAWLEWLQNSPYYQQVARLATDSPAHDLRALHQAGLHTLYQWAEQPNLVQVSPRTRSALNAAVQHSVTIFMDEVARVVNTSTHQKSVLDHWLADVVGKFVLDSLGVSVEAASAAMWEQRGNGLMPRDVRPVDDGTGANAADGDTRSGANVMSLLLGDEAPASRARRKHGAAAAASASAGTTVLPPGECCTLEHYVRFVRKVVASVRKDAERRGVSLGGGARRGGGGGAGSESLTRDAQSEMEITERSNALIATALTQLLEQASAHLPDELKELYQGGYLALGRVSELLKGAMTMLSIRDIPVRYFVLHSTLDSSRPSSTAAAPSKSGAGGSADPLLVQAPSFAPGVFLTGTAHMDVTLKDWTGAADPSSGVAPASSATVGSPSGSAGPGASVAHQQQQQQQQLQHDDPVVAEYISVLHRLRRHVLKLSATSLFEIVQAPEQYGGYGFNASEALGMDQLFGAAKLVEDRLAAVLSYPAATVRKPIHVLEAGYTSGKTAVLERLAAHRVRAGERAVVVRYKSASTPFMADLDDHPIAFPSRFWFRAALATCPYFVRTEELFSRAPRSVMWWGNERNWSWSSFQRLILSPSTSGTAGAVKGSSETLAAVLVDDFDVVLDAMASKWGDDVASSANAASAAAAVAMERAPTPIARQPGDDVASEEDVNWMESSPEVGDDASPSHPATAAAVQPAPLTSGVSTAHALLAANPEADLAAAITAEQRHIARARWTAMTGKPFRDVLDSCFGKLTIALGQVSVLVTGHHVSPLLLTHSSGVPCQRYFLPLSSGVGLQQRLRVLPLMATLHALHLHNGLEMPGVLYEVLKNMPALAGKVLEYFWAGRINLLNLRLGAARGWGPRQDGSVPLLRGYAVPELFEDLPERHYLFTDPRRERTRLVQLLQRQVGNATGFLLTGVDTTRKDDHDGIILPHHNTASQVSPFALFLVLSRLEELEGLADGASSAALANTREKRVVRAWAEVWTQYAYVVGMMATIPERKREAMRVLLQGVLLLRAASVAGVELELNLKVPAYGFPLLATDTGSRHHHSNHPQQPHQQQPSRASDAGAGAATADAGSHVHALSAQTVNKAVSAYRSFFASASQSHFSFAPLPGRNGGCDLVMLAGSSILFYDVVTTAEERTAVTLRFAETLLGMLHVLEKQVLPADRVRQLHYITVVSLDHQSTRASQSGSVTAQDLHRNSSSAAYASAAPYYMDMGSVLDDSLLDRLHILQEPLGLGKKAFRTLNDLVDELERAFHVRVRHDFCATQEELEALFTPTLLQLVPDATVLPPYQSPVVTAEDLMMKAMFEAGGADDDDDGLQDALILDMEDDGMVRGAEVEDINGDAHLARDRNASPQLQRDVLGADNEALQESAALLEVMLNDELNLLTGAPERRQKANAAIATDLHRDLAIENSLNYHIDPSTISGAAGAAASASAAPASAPVGSAVGDNNANNSHGPRGGGNQGEDSLAWLHDILSPDTLMGGLRGATHASSAATGAHGETTAASAGADASPSLSALPESASLFSRFSEPLESTGSTFGLPIQPAADNWLHASRATPPAAAAGAAGAEVNNLDGDEEAADEDGLLDLDEDDDEAADTSARKKPARRQGSAKKTSAKTKAAGRGAGRGHRSGSSNDAEGEVVTLEDLLMEVGRRNSAARRTRPSSARRTSGKAASAGTSAASRKSKKSASSSSARHKTKAAAAKTRKAPAAKRGATRTSSAAQNKNKKRGASARRGSR